MVLSCPGTQGSRPLAVPRVTDAAACFVDTWNTPSKRESRVTSAGPRSLRTLSWRAVGGEVGSCKKLVDMEPENVRRLAIKLGRNGGFLLGDRMVTLAVKLLHKSNVKSRVKAGGGR